MKKRSATEMVVDPLGKTAAAPYEMAASRKQESAISGSDRL